MSSELLLDVRITPHAALSRVEGAINRPRKRTFGVLKTENEYVGWVKRDAFEIWERHQRAVHAVGRVGGQQGYSRIEVRFVLPKRTRVLLGLFSVLYVVVAAGIALQPPDMKVSTQEFLIAIAGAGVTAGVFALSAWRQRADLRGFLERVFDGVPRR